MSATLFDDLCDAYPKVAPSNIAELLDRAERYVRKLKFPLPEPARTSVLTLCCLKGLDKGREWAYEAALWSLLSCYAMEAGRER